MNIRIVCALKQYSGRRKGPGLHRLDGVTVNMIVTAVPHTNADTKKAAANIADLTIFDVVFGTIVDHDAVTVETGAAGNTTVPDHNALDMIFTAATCVRRDLPQQNADIAVLHGPASDVHACPVKKVDADAEIGIAQ